MDLRNVTDLGSGLGSLLIWSQIWIRVWVYFLLQVGLDFGSEKCHSFGVGFNFNVVTDLDSGFGLGQFQNPLYLMDLDLGSG